MGSMGHDNESFYVEVWRDGRLLRITRAEFERMQREKDAEAKKRKVSP